MAYCMIRGKKLFYEEFGDGRPLVLLPGDGVSSRMFEPMKDLYQKGRRLILVDYLDTGRSDRRNELPSNPWQQAAQEVIALLEERAYGPVDLLGASGGALVALEVALRRPDLVKKVIADSFEGECPLESVVQALRQEREEQKQDPEAGDFLTFCHGEDWEQVLDRNTQAILDHAQSGEGFFSQSLEQLRRPVLLAGSRQDPLMPPGYLEDCYRVLSQRIPNSRVHLFDEGDDPACLSNEVEFAAVAQEFLDKDA